MQHTLHRIGTYKLGYLERPTKLHRGLLKTSVLLESVKEKKKMKERERERDLVEEREKR